MNEHDAQSDQRKSQLGSTTGLPAGTPSFVGVHHIAIICSDFARSRDFYTRILGMSIISERYRAERKSHKADLAIPGGGQIELFSFPNPPKRPSKPEALGLRHLALRTRDMDKDVSRLQALGVDVEPVRVDEYTGSRYTFFADPDGLPIELYEA